MNQSATGIVERLQLVQNEENYGVFSFIYTFSELWESALPTIPILMNESTVVSYAGEGTFIFTRKGPC